MKPLALAINCRGILSFIAVLATIVFFSTSALAVEDGLGTNVVKNLRVQPGGSLVIDNSSPGGSITLNGDNIMDWNDLIMRINYDSNAEISSLSNKVTVLENSTNELHAAVTNEIFVRVAAETGISNAYITADDVVSNAFRAADLGVSNAFRASDVGISNAYITADDVVSNAFRGADIIVSNALDTAKYDKTGGPISGDVNISGNVIMSNKVVYVPSNETVVAGTAIGSGQAVKTISAAGDVVMNVNPPIAAGSAGQMITLIYNGANSVTFSNNNDDVGLRLSGEISFTMSRYDVIQFVSDGAKWIEVHRADNPSVIP